MKTSIKILFLAVIMAAISACSAQKRAERHIRRAVELCPELAQMKAHIVDTVLTAPAFADVTTVPMVEVMQGKTVYAPTTHGTVIVKLRPDSTLKVGFEAAPMPVHYQDTISYAQVVMPQTEATTSHGSAWMWIGCFLLGVIISFVVLIVITVKAKIHE